MKGLYCWLLFNPYANYLLLNVPPKKKKKKKERKKSLPEKERKLSTTIRVTTLYGETIISQVSQSVKIFMYFTSVGAIVGDLKGIKRASIPPRNRSSSSINPSENNQRLFLFPHLTTTQSTFQVSSTSIFKSIKMQFTVFSVLAFAASMVSASAVPHAHFARQNGTTHPNCVGSLLTCPQLKTPLDPILDPILQALDINGSAVIGDIGLLCMSWPSLQPPLTSPNPRRNQSR